MGTTFSDLLTTLTLNELYKTYASIVDSAQGMAHTINAEDRKLALSKLIIINNEIREREASNGN